MTDFKTFQKQARDFSIMFVEDSTSQQQQMGAFLRKFFAKVLTEVDGASGFETFKREHPDIVVTDIEMPDMSGLDMARNIKAMDPDVPVIVMSAYDAKEYLRDAIRYGVVSYIKKPAQATELAEIFSETIETIKKRKDRNLFVTYLQHVFDYQNNLILLLEKSNALVANPMFLDFFGVRDIQELNDAVGDIGERFVPQNGFLSNDPQYLLDVVMRDPGRHHHVKIMRGGDDPIPHHFLLSYRPIPKKEHYGLLLLDDITDLNLLDLFTQRPELANDIPVTPEMIKSVLRLIKEHRLQIKMHNFYKGLSITNPAAIVEGDPTRLYIKTAPHQLRASHYEKSLVISSDALPHFIACKEIVSVDYDQGMIVAQGIHFMRSSPTQRRHIRVVPAEEHTAVLHYKERRYADGVTIIDISIDAVKLEMPAIPAGLKAGQEVDIVLNITLPDKKELAIDTPGQVIRTADMEGSFQVVVGYDLRTDLKRELVDMIAKRQMELIREFKRLQ